MDKMDKLLVGLLLDLFLRAFCYETLFLRGQGPAGAWFAGLVLCSVQVVKDLHGLVRLDLTEDFHHLVKQLEMICLKHGEIDAMLSFTFRTLVYFSCVVMHPPNTVYLGSLSRGVSELSRPDSAEFVL